MVKSDEIILLLGCKGVYVGTMLSFNYWNMASIGALKSDLHYNKN